MIETKGDDKGGKMFRNKFVSTSVFDVTFWRVKCTCLLDLSFLRADEAFIAKNVLKESVELAQRSNLHSLNWWKCTNLTTVLGGPCV